MRGDDMKYFDCQHKDHRIINEQLQPRLYRLVEDWCGRWVWSDGSEINVFLKAGFLYDGMSIPNIGMSIAKLHPDSYREGVAPHDLSYRSRGGRDKDKMQGCTITNQNGNRICISKTQTDFILKTTMDCMWATKRQVRWVNLACRVGGWYHWGGPMPYQKK